MGNVDHDAVHARALVQAIGAYGLGPAFALDRPVAPALWAAVLRGVVSARVQPQMAMAIREGAWPVTARQRDEALGAHRDALAHVVRAEGLLLTAAAALRQAGIEFRVLKGAGVARLDYPDPTLRVFGDVDLLVRGVAFAQALRVLAGLGARRTEPPLREGFDERFAKAVPLLLRNGMQVDLHRSLALEPFGLLVDLDSLFRDREWFVVGDTALPALGMTHRFLHACYHAILDRTGRTLLPLRDVAQMLRRPDLDEAAVIREALCWRGGAVVSAAVRRARELAAGAARDLDAWASGYRPARQERFALGAFDDAGRRRVQRAVATAWMVPGLRERASYAATLLRPSPQFVALQGGYLRWLRRGLSRPGRRGP